MFRCLQLPARAKAWTRLPAARRVPARADNGGSQLAKQAATLLPSGCRSAEEEAPSINAHARTAGNTIADGAASGFDGGLSVDSHFSGEWTWPDELPATSALVVCERTAWVLRAGVQRRGVCLLHTVSFFSFILQKELRTNITR